jgi:hypothetical protein
MDTTYFDQHWPSSGVSKIADEIACTDTAEKLSLDGYE